MSEPRWLELARADVGVRETLGPNDAPWIRRMWAALSGSWLLGQPWCGGAAARWMQLAGLPIPKNYFRAKAWLDWGTPQAVPAVGSVVVFERVGGGHVGFVVGKTPKGLLLVLGGNQNDQVKVSAFDPSRVSGYRWPPGLPAPYPNPLPVLGAAALSTSEA